MALWGAEVKAGEPYVVEPSGGRRRLRITQATLGNLDVVGWSTVEASAAASGDHLSVRLCALNPIHNPVTHLDLEIEEDEGVVVSVTGNSSVHLAGYYIIPAATAAGGAGDGTSRHHCRLTEQRLQIPDNGGENKKKSRIEEDEIHVTTGGGDDRRHCHLTEQHRQILDNGEENKKKLMIEEGEVHATAGGGDNHRHCHLMEQHRQIPNNGGDNKKKPRIEEDEVHATTGGGDDRRHCHVTKQHRHIPNKGRENTKKQRIEEDEVHTVGAGDVGGGSTSRPTERRLEILDKEKKKTRIEEDEVHSAPDENTCPHDGVDHDTRNESWDEDHTTHGGDDVENTDDNQEKGGAAVRRGLKGNNEGTTRRVKTETTTLIPEAHRHDKVIIEELIVGPSTGDQITSRNTTVKVKYVGRLVNSPEIVDPTDGSDTYTFKISASEVIPGWEHGIIGMRVGGKRRLTIPPSLGYGDKGKGGVIPPNSWLVYEIDLLQVLPRKRA